VTRSRPLRRAASARLERLIDRAVGPRLDAQQQQLASLSTEVEQLRGTLVGLAAKLDETRAIAASAVDGIPELRRMLVAARGTAAYEAVWAEREPLVTVCVPTYARAQLLVERALSSVVAQTYQNLEVIVVGDGCADETEQRVSDLGDPRIRFVNMPFRYPYPEDAERRWLVAGAPGANLGAQLARGSWIAFLGDDDEFTPDHLELLLDHARAGRFEMVYGQMHQHRPAPYEDILHATYPPRHEEFGVQAALFMAALRFFDFNVTSWVVGEPADWNLCRRMLEAGVRIGFVDRVVTHYYPSKLHGMTAPPSDHSEGAP
jgi:glycosyl transferase family 2